MQDCSISNVTIELQALLNQSGAYILKSSRYILCFLVLIFITFSSSLAFAQLELSPNLSDPDIKAELSAGSGSGASIIGDSIDLESGAFTLSTTDVSLQGNFDLPVAFSRSYALDGVDYHGQVLGSWNIDVPFITARVLEDGVTPHQDTSNTIDGWKNNRCTETVRQWFPAALTGDPLQNANDDVWGGARMFIPGQGGKLLLETVTGSNTAWGGTKPQKTTIDHWRVDCLGNLQNGPGEGFEATSPDGIKYTFNYWAPKEAGTLGVFERGETCNDSFCDLDSLERFRAFAIHANIYATEIRDVNNNWVRYDYDTIGQLRRIHSSDLREIVIEYDEGHIESVKVNAGTVKERVWTYDYSVDSLANRNLQKVTLPDGTFWEYGLPAQKPHQRGNGHANGSPVPTGTLSVTHPFGAQAKFDYTLTQNGKTNVSNEVDGWVGSIWPPGASEPIEVTSPFEQQASTWTKAITQKTIIVSPTETYVWNYWYEQDAGHRNGSGEPPLNDQKRRIITDPEGYETHLWYDRRHLSQTEYMMMKSEIYDGGTMVSRSTPTYLEAPSLGDSSVRMKFAPSRTSERLTTKTVTHQNGDTFTTEYDYNTNPNSPTYSFGRPVETRSWSNYSISDESRKRITQTTYEHNKDKWILGLPKTVRRNGRLVSTTDYTPLGQAHKRYDYSQTTPAGTYSYHSDGTLASMTDALGRTTEADDWHRGQPQTVTRPDGSTIKRSLDDNGWIMSQTDAKGRTTTYQRDVMGRLTRITPHTPSSGFKDRDTVISYNFNSTPIIQMITKGPRRDFVYYDSLLRPTLEGTYDFTTAELNWTRNEYDALGRQIFKSFPSPNAGNSDGTETDYDALGRVTQTRETVAPFATTRHEYLNFHRYKVTDPEGRSTTTYQYGWDGPDSGVPYLIRQHRGSDITTDTWIRRNVHGQIWRVDQNGTSGGFNVNQKQHFYYDAQQRLCRTRTPEGGDSVYAYNLANEMIAYAKGQSASGSCGAPSGNAKVNMTYDDLGRLKTTDFTDPATPDIWRDYDVNGNITKLYRGSGANAVNWDYRYDGYDRLIGEELVIAGAPEAFDIRYLYNGNGHMYRKYLPSGRGISYANDGLGRHSKLSWGGAIYADNASYHPSGALKTLSFGNGQAFTQALNRRLLPERLSVSKNGVDVQNLSYDYYADGRVKNKVDSVDSAYSAIHIYDGAGRLERANSAAWGAAAYRYDALGNLREKRFNKNGAIRTVTNNYNSRNRIISSIDTANIGYGFNYDSRGNIRTAGLLNFTYDMSDQPVAMNGRAPNTGTQVNANYLYDGNMKRVKSVVNGKTIYNVYDAAGRLVHVDEATDGKETDYLHGMGQTLARIKNGVFTYLHPDHLGSPQLGTGENGNVAFREAYSPYGEALLSPAANDNQSGFTGHIKDKSTGLNYMQARYYDPNIGRFLSIDPVTFLDTGKPEMFNRYSYAANDPINAFDPDGRQTVVIKDDGPNKIVVLPKNVYNKVNAKGSVPGKSSFNRSFKSKSQMERFATNIMEKAEAAGTVTHEGDATVYDAKPHGDGIIGKIMDKVSDVGTDGEKYGRVVTKTFEGSSPQNQAEAMQEIAQPSVAATGAALEAAGIGSNNETQIEVIATIHPVKEPK